MGQLLLLEAQEMVGWLKEFNFKKYYHKEVGLEMELPN